MIFKTVISVVHSTNVAVVPIG